MNLKVLLFYFNFINECLLFTIYFIVKCEFLFMFVFVIGFVFVFVILKGKIIKLKFLKEKSRKHKIDFLFLYFKIESWIGPQIRGFRLGPEVAWQGSRGPNEASLRVKKNLF